MSDKGSNSPAASPDAHHLQQHQDEGNDSASPVNNGGGASSASPKSSPRAAGNNDEDMENAASRESGADDDAERRRATSRSPSPSERKEPADPAVANPGNNLYVANLPHKLTQTDLEELFAKFGRLDKCEVIVDPVTRESRGFGFVTFEDVRDAGDAVTELNGKEIQGRRIRVEHAKRKAGHEKTPGKYLGPRLASSKYGRDARGGGGGSGRSRSRSRDRPARRSRSRSRDRGHGRRYDDRERFDRRYDDRGDHGRGGYDRGDRYDGRRSRR